MKKSLIVALGLAVLVSSCGTTTKEKGSESIEQYTKSEKTVESIFPKTIKVEGIAQNPEGIEFDRKNNTFLLSSLNAGPIIKVELDGEYSPFTSDEPFPMSTAGLQVDYKHNRLLATAFNGTALYDNDPETKGISHLRIYDLDSGEMKKDIDLSALIPEAEAYFANDVAIDQEGNVYVTDWFAGVVYQVDKEGNPTVLWKNETGIKSGSNGIDYHPNGYLLVSLVSVDEKGLYSDYALVKIPVNDPNSASVVEFSNSGYTGFDGMVLTASGNIVGITNNGRTAGGNTLIEVSSSDDWETAKVIRASEISASTTVAVTPDHRNYVIHQDFANGMQEDWTIEQIEF